MNFCINVPWCGCDQPVALCRCLPPHAFFLKPFHFKRFFLTVTAMIFSCCELFVVYNRQTFEASETMKTYWNVLWALKGLCESVEPQRDLWGKHRNSILVWICTFFEGKRLFIELFFLIFIVQQRGFLSFKRLMWSCASGHAVCSNVKNWKSKAASKEEQQEEIVF